MSKVPFASGDSCEAWQAPHFSHGETGHLEYNSEPPLLTREQQQAVRQQAYDEAFAQGYQEGVAQGSQKMAGSLSQLTAILDVLQAPLEELDTAVVEELVTLCMAVVRQMVRRELKISPGEIVAVVRESLGLLPIASGDITLELHPEDAQIVRDALVKNGADPGWQIVEDPLLSRGGCRVLTKTSRIDATVENRLNAAIAAVMGGERHVD